MFKKKILAGALALSLVLAGTGYAYWTDALKVTTKATTGNFDVTFVDFGLLAQYTNENAGWSIIDGITDKHVGYVGAEEVIESPNDFNNISRFKYADRQVGYNSVKYTDSKLVNPEDINVVVGDYGKTTKGSDEIRVSIENIYPGYAQAFRTDILNIGNMAATLSNIRFMLNEENVLDESIGVALYMEYENYDTKPGTYGDVFKLAALFNTDDTFVVGNVRFVKLSALRAAMSNNTFKEQLDHNTLLIKSSNRMDLLLGIAMDPATTAPDTMKKVVSFDIELDWTQFNEGIGQTAPANKLGLQN